MCRPARALATWIAVLALTAQTLAFALHGPFRVLADTDGGLVICTAEGLKRIGAGQSDIPPRIAEHACAACVTLASTAVPPLAAQAATIAHAATATTTPATHSTLAARPALGPAQPRAPPVQA